MCAGLSEAFPLRYSRHTSGTLAEERTRLTRAKADREELNLRVRSKELIEVVTVEKSLFEKGRQVREALQSIPDRLAGILAAEQDQLKVHSALSKEIHQALEALTCPRQKPVLLAGTVLVTEG